MASSKRAAARNEKILQELVQGQTCADCHARNPAWASWSLGVFLCMRCAAIHRKLGTHISKVKSLSMDSWTNEQVDNMRKVGNATSNKIYNPQNKKPPVPVDADEVDSAMERFIRQKYMNNSVSSARRHDTGSTESDETPPPLPPKTPSRFGFRSASSIFPLSSKAKKDAAASSFDPRRPPPSSRDFPDRNPGSPRNKASKVFGASVQYDNPDDVERKLARLRDMGFTDNQRNAMVLRGMNGNLEKTVEALVRLGEGDGRTLTSPRDAVPPPKRSLTPSSTLSVPQAGRAQTPNSLSPSTNPFDMLDAAPAQPQSSQSTGTLQNKNPYNSSPTNPFAVSHQQGIALDQALQNMSLSPSQPLFPHHTGGLPAATPGQMPVSGRTQMEMQHPTHAIYQQQQQQQQQHQQALLPPMSTVPQSMPFNGTQTYAAPVQQQMQTGTNPFFTTAAQQQPAPQAPLTVNTTAAFAQYGNNPFLARSPTRVQSPSMLAQIPEQSQQDFHSGPSSLQQSWAAPGSAMPYSAPASAPPLYNNPFFTAAQPMQHVAPPRPDKASIMALYNSPQPATNPFQPQMNQFSPAIANPLQQSMQPAPSAQQQQQPQPQPQQQQQQQQQQQAAPSFTAQVPTRAMTSPPTSGAKNPFLSLGGGGPEFGGGAALGGARSRDSVLAQGLEWSNGRHSPDAFASLSARDMR